MRYLKRIAEDKLLKIAREFPVVVVSGARQVGKSTLLDHLFGKDLRSFEFDPVVDVGNARMDPELFLSLNPPPVILDEIQYAPELLPIIKRMVDKRADERGLFFISGSQQFSVIKSISESLAGRAALLELLPMCFKEISESVDEPGAFMKLLSGAHPDDVVQIAPAENRNIASLIVKGGYPRTLDMDENAALLWFESYLKTYVERDIRILGDIGDLQMFTRFVKLCAQLTAQEINHSHLGREIGVDPKTAKSWLAILSASFQWFELQPYFGNATKRLAGKSKGYFSDTGFACYLASIFSSTALATHPLFGSLFESYVVSEIIKQLQYLPAKPSVYHWRTHGGAEVDLVIEKDGGFWLIEAKLAARPTLADARGIRAFAETYPKNRIAGKIIVSGGTEIYKLARDIIVVPVAML